jgi:hypothetical protein
MCDKCVEIDKKIDHYKWLARQMSDGRALQGINELIQQHEAQERSLHSEKE